MPSNDEKARRKELLHSHRDEQRRNTRGSFPAPVLVLKGMFDFLDSRLSERACDHTLRFTRDYVSAKGMNEDSNIQWLEKHGGHCDCEVLNNVEEVVAEAAPEYNRIGSETDTVN